MKKLILLFIVFVNLAFSYNYNDVLLKAQASMFPKIILLDKNIEEKLIDGTIIYTIVYDQSDYNTVLEISEYIDTKYNGFFDKYAYKIQLLEFKELSMDTQTSALYVLNSDNYIKKAATIAKQKGIIAFAYDIANLKNGLVCSLMIEKSTVLYLNKESLSTQKVDFVDSLLQMVKFVDKGVIRNKMLLNNSWESRTMYAKMVY